MSVEQQGGAGDIEGETRDVRAKDAPPPELLDGLTPAQIALAGATVSAVPPEKQILEDRLNVLFELIGEVMSADLASKYHDLLLQFASDQTIDGVTYLGIERAPAARGNHHAFEGGLVFHILELWRIWTVLRDGLTHDDPHAVQVEDGGWDRPPQVSDLIQPPHLTDERVLAAVINHDLAKGYATYVQEPTTDGSWKVSYGKHISADLLNATLKSIWMLGQAGIVLDEEQLHALGQAEGGWSDQKAIVQTSVLAKLCYAMDELSANVLGRIARRTLLNRSIPVSSSVGFAA